MFDLSWSHIAILVVVALLVLGPTELPNAIRTGAQLLRAARKMAGEFRSGVDELIREAELDETRRSIQEVMTADVGNTIASHVDPTGEIKSALDKDELTKDLSGITHPTNLIVNDPPSAPPHSLGAPALEEAAPGSHPVESGDLASRDHESAEAGVLPVDPGEGESKTGASTEEPAAPAAGDDSSADLKKKSA
jgi:sec-independent protein translocase protein TatB